jgi:rSAM/selenodomain-associated transferase 2
LQRLSVIVPALEEAAGIEAALAALSRLRSRGAEVIVVDGGSADATATLAAPLADRVIAAPRGRARQMNAGAALASGDVFLFLHADTRLPEGADREIERALASGAHAWGRFDARIEGGAMLAVVSRMMNARSRLTGIATGDQAIFMTRAAFEAVGGFPDIALMEDVAICKKLKRLSPPACLAARVVTSGRRWKERGTLATIVLMWRLRLAFALGADPVALARRYERARPS